MEALVDVLYGVLVFSLALLSYVYIGYPLMIGVVAALRPRRVTTGDAQPSVSVVLAVWNEADRIAQKIQDLKQLDYPQDKLEIIVVDDGSTDGTASIVSGFADHGVHVISLEKHSGKAAALNAAIKLARMEVVLFSDVRQVVPSDALSALVASFSDQAVGAVSATLCMSGHRGPGMYWRYEKWIRRSESLAASLVGVTGAFWSARRRLLVELPDNVILDDVYQPMQIAMAGYRVVLAPDAKVFDSETEIDVEFDRKVRTLAGNYQLIRMLPELLLPRRNRLFWQFVSHKLMRLISPMLLVALFVCNLLILTLAVSPSPLESILAVLQVVFYGIAFWGVARQKSAGRLSRFAATFVVMNAAALVGLQRYLFGHEVWGRAIRRASSASRAFRR